MKWILILLTWYGTVDQMTQEIDTKDERDCRRMERNIKEGWADAPREFVGITECREIVLSND